jgi:hypothetical protein
VYNKEENVYRENQATDGQQLDEFCDFLSFLGGAVENCVILGHVTASVGN